MGSLGGLSDGQLLDRFIDRREEAVFEAIVRRHGPMVWGVCRRVLRDHHDAEDAFQATFLVLARKANSVMIREKLGNWLYGVAYQTATKAKAMRAKRRAREGQVSDMPEPMVVPDEPRDDLAESLDRELSRLPEKYRIPIVLCDLEGISRKEAARQLGWPIGTVSSRLSRARSLLAGRLARRGLSLSVGSLAVLLAQESASARMPTQLICPTAKAASLFAARGAVTAGVVSAEVVALTGEVLKIMLLGRLKVATALLLMASATVLALVPLAAQSEAPVVREAAREEPNDRPKTDVAKPSLPPRALARIGTDLLRTPGNIRSFALSPGGRLIAAGDLPPRVPGLRSSTCRPDSGLSNSSRRETSSFGGGSRRPRSRPTARNCSGARCPERSRFGNCRTIGCCSAEAPSGQRHGREVLARWPLFRQRRTGRGHPSPAGRETRGPRARFHDADARTPGVHARRPAAGRGGPVQHNDLGLGDKRRPALREIGPTAGDAFEVDGCDAG